MEIIIGLVVIVVVGLLWHANSKSPVEAKSTVDVKPKTLNAADVVAPVITPSPNPMQSLPVSVAVEPVKGPAVEGAGVVDVPAKKTAKAKKPAVKKAKAPAKTAAKKTPVRKSGGKKVG